MCSNNLLFTGGGGYARNVAFVCFKGGKLQRRERIYKSKFLKKGQSLSSRRLRRRPIPRLSASKRRALSRKHFHTGFIFCSHPISRERATWLLYHQINPILRFLKSIVSSAGCGLKSHKLMRLQVMNLCWNFCPLRRSNLRKAARHGFFSYRVIYKSIKWS